ncbi:MULTISPECIES: hypothetical protein [unclassified Mesorhizobium]|uniref:hypothetical protein n=1 Tax=unclassified Mesorhizobium TaxID=325217 RepID=UPI00112822B9|nr:MULTISPECIES: hypothetical protein [unclassified Mesorhizobium]TPN44060.1 hypothetical protein FJ976_26680 [Mesorhizobium sp. B1-1-9]TPN54872.1 hypothetical protein FJ978_05115 [Mesorhizobium sp. B1-1-7]
MAKARHAAEMECSPTSSTGHFFVFSNKNFSLHVEVLSYPRPVRYAGCGSGKGISSYSKTAEAACMNKADEARESGVSRGVDRTARCILNIISESAGPRHTPARGSVIYCVRNPGSQKFLSWTHEGDFPVTSFEPPPFGMGELQIVEMRPASNAVEVITNCFSGERGDQPRVVFQLGRIRRREHAAA